MAELWRKVTNGVFDASMPNAEALLRWDDDACDKFDIYLQRNAAPQLLQEQLPLLLAAGLKHVDNTTSSSRRQDGASNSGPNSGRSNGRQHDASAVPVAGGTAPEHRPFDRFAAQVGQG